MFDRSRWPHPWPSSRRIPALVILLLAAALMVAAGWVAFGELTAATWAELLLGLLTSVRPERRRARRDQRP